MREPPRGGLGYLLVGQPNISSLVARALATKGDQPQFLEGRYELGITALDLTGMEYRWLRRSSTFEVHVNVAAVAAQFGYAALGISLGLSGRFLCTVESIILSNTTGARLGYNFGVRNLALGAAVGPNFGFSADDRSLSAASDQQSSAFGLGGTNAAPGFGTTRGRFCSLLSGESQVIPGPWVLSGKDNGVTTVGLWVVADTVNATLQVSFRWSERELLASET